MRQATAPIVLGLTATVAWAACGTSSPPPAGPGTRAIDCVAVLGILGQAPPTRQIPLASVPFSGAPRDKRYAELDDADLGKVCDFGACVSSNGYGRDCFTTNAPYDPRDPSGSFQLETVPLIADGMRSCFPTKPGATAPSWNSREDCITILRRQLGDCQVQVVEDCERETLSGAFLPDVGPDCLRENCGPGATASSSGPGGSDP